MTPPASRWLPRRARRSGVAAVEFALVAPLLLLMLIATFEFVNAIRIQTKLSVAAGQLAEMIAGQQSVTEGSAEGPGGTLGDMCTAASYNLYPYDPSKLSADIQSATVTQPSGTQVTTDWINDKSCPTFISTGSSSEGTLLTNIADLPRSLFTIDGQPKINGGVLVRGYSAISLQLTYVYSNLTPFLLGKTMTFYAIAAARPRSNTTITCTYGSGSNPPPCPSAY